jgi:hypothetical protein
MHKLALLFVADLHFFLMGWTLARREWLWVAYSALVVVVTMSLFFEVIPQ